MRTRMFAPLLVLSLFTLLPITVHGELPRAVGLASASGDTLVLWGRLPPLAVAYGQGRIIVKVQGEYQGQNQFSYFQLSMSLEASWKGPDGTSYTLKMQSVVPMSTKNRGTIFGDIHPDVGAFIAFLVGFRGSLAVGAATYSVSGKATVYALTPDTSFQESTGRYLSTRLIVSSDSHAGITTVILGWSEIDQTVGGLVLHSAARYAQRVRINVG